VPSARAHPRFLSIASLGLISGVVLSLLAPSIHVLATDDSSRDILTAMKSDLTTWEVAAREKKKLLPLNKSARGEHGSTNPRSTKHVLSKNDRELEKILASSRPQQRSETVRLAAYHAEPFAALRPESSVALSAGPIQRPAATKASYQALHPSTQSRALVGRVHSVINKYAPNHKSSAKLAHAIVQESLRQGVDPLFVAAVIKSESAFNTSARSHKGAQGLMQIMPATGAWIVARHDLPRGKLTDPGHNLRLGVSYLKYLDETYRGNRIFTLVAYNWGPGHVDSASGGRRRIPKECMKYALKIMQDYRLWSSGVI